jgi:hypothetical protein
MLRRVSPGLTGRSTELSVDDRARVRAFVEGAECAPLDITGTALAVPTMEA